MSSISKLQILDEMGNINTEILQNELQQSLKSDIVYKQTDNAKKKAVKVSANYDEFKARVNCAHLKTLNRSEIESLKDIKKGWSNNSRSHTQGDKELKLLNSNNTTSNSQSSVCLTSSSSSINMPKSVSDIEKSLNRFNNNEDKLRYLSYTHILMHIFVHLV